MLPSQSQSQSQLNCLLLILERHIIVLITLQTNFNWAAVSEIKAPIIERLAMKIRQPLACLAAIRASRKRGQVGWADGANAVSHVCVFSLLRKSLAGALSTASQ